MILKTFSFLCVLLMSFHILDGMPHSSPDMRIINGKNASVGEFPFMGAVYYKGYFTCGAAVLSEEWVMTAAHCVYDRDEHQLSVLTGTNDLQDPEGTETPVSEVIVHQGYQYTDNQINDIALLRLSIALEFDNLTQPVTLSSPTTDPAPNDRVVVMGWGVNKYQGNPVQFLQKATISMYSNAECDAAYGPYNIDILPTNLCAGSLEGGVGQCTGDSGGPVVVEGSRTYQVGIVSFSAKPCGIKGFPGVNTRVSQYLDWIKNKTSL